MSQKRFLKSASEFLDFFQYLSWLDLKASIFSISVPLSSEFQFSSVELLIFLVALMVVESLILRVGLYFQLFSPFSEKNKMSENEKGTP